MSADLRENRRFIFNDRIVFDAPMHALNRPGMVGKHKTFRRKPLPYLLC
jgi:hypothetical protein